MRLGHPPFSHDVAEVRVAELGRTVPPDQQLPPQFRFK